MQQNFGGNVKILNDDCMNVMKEMPNSCIDFVMTDIPYDEVNRDSGGLRNLDKGSADVMTFNLHEFLHELLRITKNSLCIFCGRRQFSDIYIYISDNTDFGKWSTRPIVWEKTNPSPMNGDKIYLSGTEFAVWAKKGGAKTFNAFCKNTVFRYPNGSSKVHPTEKNHELLRELILDNTNAGDIVFDPCMGSGSSLLVALENDRKAVGCELSKEWFDIAKRRIDDLQKATSLWY